MTTKGVKNEALGRYIRTRRESRELDVRTAAEQAELDPSYWWKLEAGRYDSPAPRYLQAIAEVLQVPLTDLYGLAGYDHTDELPGFTPYLRTKYPELSPEDVRGLERYFDLLRSYYGIPKDQPVFPPKPKSKQDDPMKPRRSKPSEGARNDASHPWRSS